MIASELKIGNWVNAYLGVNDDGPDYANCKIEGIQKDYVWASAQHGMVQILSLNSIILSPDILKRCEGFELAKDGEHWFIGCHGWCLLFDGEDYCVKMRIDEPYVVCYLRHVHQLQNFLPFITQKELNIHL